MAVRLDFFEKALFLQFRDDQACMLRTIFAAVTSIQSPLSPRPDVLPVDAALVVEDDDLVQAVALADLEVVEIVARRDLDHAGAELAIDIASAISGSIVR